jgi:hypothetical protein
MEMTLEQLERHWMPFTPNRDFKRHPRMFVRASGMHYFDPSCHRERAGRSGRSSAYRSRARTSAGGA